MQEGGRERSEGEFRDCVTTEGDLLVLSYSSRPLQPTVGLPPGKVIPDLLHSRVRYQPPIKGRRALQWGVWKVVRPVVDVGGCEEGDDVRDNLAGREGEWESVRSGQGEPRCPLPAACCLLPRRPTPSAHLSLRLYSLQDFFSRKLGRERSANVTSAGWLSAARSLPTPVRTTTPTLSPPLTCTHLTRQRPASHPLVAPDRRVSQHGSSAPEPPRHWVSQNHVRERSCAMEGGDQLPVNAGELLSCHRSMREGLTSNGTRLPTRGTPFRRFSPP